MSAPTPTQVCTAFGGGHAAHFGTVRTSWSAEWRLARILDTDGTRITVRIADGTRRLWHHDPQRLTLLGEIGEHPLSHTLWCGRYALLRVGFGSRSLVTSFSGDPLAACRLGERRRSARTAEELLTEVVADA